MPEYLFSNPKNPEEIVSVFMGMNDDKVLIKNGVKWNREYTVPEGRVDGKYNCFSAKDFVSKTANKRGTVGDLWEKSAELSAEREKKMGRDEVKEKTRDNWEKERKRPHPERQRAKVKESLNKKGIDVQF